MSIVIARAGADRLDDVRELWLALHRHHRATAALPVVADDETSWQLRRATYAAWLAADEALLLVATEEGRPVGYAMVHLLDGPDDTWPWGERAAELYSLSVAADHRNQGVGGRLLDQVDDELDRLGIDDLQVAVMVGNAAAQRLYERRGFQPGEVVLYRFGRG
jgi:ribosomal protein S18 acetylase RimI-like enzyme